MRNLFNQFLNYLQLLPKACLEIKTLKHLLESDNFLFVKRFPPGHFHSPVPDVTEMRQGIASGLNT